MLLNTQMFAVYIGAAAACQPEPARGIFQALLLLLLLLLPTMKFAWKLWCRTKLECSVYLL